MEKISGAAGFSRKNLPKEKTDFLYLYSLIA